MTYLSIENISFQNFQFNNVGLLYAALVINFIVMIAVFCFHKLARQVPTNYILLSIFTFTEAYMVSAISATYQPQIVVMAAVMTAAMTFTLTLYACTTKNDITMYGGALFICSCGVLLLCLFGFFIASPIFQVVIAVVVVILFGFYLIYDTQLIIGGGRYELSIDDYIIGALIIYIDIIVLFLRILQILSYLRGQN